MKAKRIKKNLKDFEPEETEDELNYEVWVVEGKKFYNFNDAKQAVRELIKKEFQERKKK